TRRFGWTVDNLEEVEIVTADGAVRRATVDDHDDLFWALRGGGGNFGIVTRFTFRLHQVGPAVTGGVVVWDAEEADDVLALYRDLSEAAPRELTLAATMRLALPSPFIPEPWHGKPVVGILAAIPGNRLRRRRTWHPLAPFAGPLPTPSSKRPTSSSSRC
ncbi:MAG: FAD-binding oxidoreductase, partial [Actinobacteria bacterium]|nr:FAD-binding oxidoreductase [Actinomycetota bacterium]